MLNNNDVKYNSYLDHKLHNKITNDFLIAQLNQRNYETNSIIEDFECFVCQQTVETNENTLKRGHTHKDICDVDLKYPKMTATSNEISNSNILKQGKCEADLLHEMILANRSFTQTEFWNEIKRRFDRNDCSI